jgi:acetylornithine deacetylase/succinyl-diaminopimelate desuccinylase-like protein
VSSLDGDRAAAEALDLIQQLCRMPSVSAEQRGLEETAGVVESMLADAGFTTRQLVVPGAAPAVYGEQLGRSPYTLLLYNHYDVQPPDPLDLWSSPPFEPTIRDGCMYARGAADNKGEIGTRLAAIHELRREHGELPIGIRWIIEGEEEVGSTHFDAIAREYADLLEADAGFWEGSDPELGGRPEIAIGFKGVLAFRLDVETLRSDAHSGSAGVIPGAPWRLLAAIAAIRDADGRVLLEGFNESVREPAEAERAALEEYGDVVERALAETYRVTRFVDGVSGRAFRERLAFAPSLNIAGISTGYRGPGTKTVTPARGSAWLDFRLVPDQDPDQVQAALRAALDGAGLADVRVTVLAKSAPVATPIDHPLVRRVAEIAERTAGARALINPMVPGTLPLLGALRDHVGVPGLSPPDNPTYPGCQVHAPDEHIRLRDIPPAVRQMRAFLEALGA